MSRSRLALEWLPDLYAVCRLESGAVLPAWARQGDGFVSITRTDAELSIVIDERVVPADVKAERGWVAFRVVGPLPFSMVGVLSRLAGALADARIPLFVISTYDTDVLLVKSDHAERAATALGKVADVD